MEPRCGLGLQATYWQEGFWIPQATGIALLCVVSYYVVSCSIICDFVFMLCLALGGGGLASHRIASNT
jgi:hypothetical protein